MPGGKHENMKPWEPADDTLLLSAVQQEGTQWKRLVEECFPDRTVSSVRNRYQRLESGRKARDAGLSSRNLCHACGEPRKGHSCKAKMLTVDLPARPPPALTLVSEASDDLTSTLKRTRSGSRLVPIDDAGPSADWASAQDTGHFASADYPFRVDVAKATEPPVPSIKRNNTSFFTDLATNGNFSPASRAMFESWAAKEPSAPPSLHRSSSHECTEPPPKLTRTLSSYLGDASSETADNPLPDLGGRSVRSFMQELIDASAALDAAPPASTPLR